MDRKERIKVLQIKLHESPLLQSGYETLYQPGWCKRGIHKQRKSELVLLCTGKSGQFNRPL